MKRLFIMLLIACSAITTISAQQKGKQDNVPYNVKALFHSIITAWGSPNDDVYSVNKNPETNQIESSVRITTFSADNDKFPHMAGKVYLNTSVISDAFKKDEPKSYQILHITPGDFKRFSLKAVNEDGQSETYQIRNNNDEEMWLMCCKNPDNPKLRDAYAIKWVITKEGTKVNGMVYQITSLRPDKYEKPLDYSKRMFKIEGRVGDDIKDSLYNIYIAESREALYNLEDHEYVACIPVVNKRFEWQTELTKPCVGRLRCIFPDGSLCSAWIDLDFVPGETYHITVHNGYYDEDKDYERRVGRQSGKSLIAETVKVVDDVPAEYHKANPIEDEFETWRKTLNEQEELQFQIKGERIELAMKKLGERYEFIKAILNGSNSGYQLDVTFQEILKLNQDLESKWQDFFKFFKTKNMPKMGYAKAYKEIIEIYTGQLRELNDYYKKHGAMSKTARKVNSYVLKQNEKYMDAMEKCIAE
jgi:hypothetical protein